MPVPTAGEYLSPRPASAPERSGSRSPGSPPPMCRANRNRRALRQQQMNRRRRSPPVSVAVLKDLAGGDTSLSRTLSPGHLLQPSLHGRPRSHPFEFGAQKLLHGLTLRSSTSGELVTHFLGDIADSDLNSHDCILPAVRSYCNHELEARTGLRSFARSALSSWHRRPSASHAKSSQPTLRGAGAGVVRTAGFCWNSPQLK
jgi:hypothetical protein